MYPVPPHQLIEGQWEKTRDIEKLQRRRKEIAAKIERLQAAVVQGRDG